MSVRYMRRKDPKTGEMREAWYVDVDFKHPDGRRQRVRRRSPIQSRRAAEQFEREQRNTLAAGGLERKEEEQKEIPRFADFADEFIDTYARVHNKHSEVISKQGILQRYLLPVFGRKKLDVITTRDIEKLKSKLLNIGLKAKTVNNALATMGKLLRYAEEVEIIEKAPRIRLLKVPKAAFDFLTFEESRELLEASKYNSEWHAMVFFALRTGVRYGELCELRWKDIDLQRGQLLVSRSFTRGQVTTTKTGRQRQIPLSEQTVAYLTTHRHLNGELVFSKNDGGRHIHRRADVALKRCCRYAEMRPIGWHVLRHTFASHLAMRGVSLKSIQEMLGHTTIEMTMRYAHLSPEVNRKAVTELDDPRLF